MRHRVLACVLALAAAEPISAQTIVLDDIVLSPTLFPTEAARTGSSVSLVTAAEIERDRPGFLLDYLQTLPGLTLNRAGGPGTVTGLSIRGLPQRYARVEVDGIPIGDPSSPTGDPTFLTLPTADIGSVELLRGSQSALYGGQAVGGVLAITTARAVEPGIVNRFLLEGGSYNTLRGAYTLAARGDRAEATVSIQRAQTDGFSAAEAGEEPDGYRSTRISASLGYALGPTARAFATGFWQRETGDFDSAFDPATGLPADAPNTYERTQYGLRGGIDFALGGIENRLALSYYRLKREETSFFTPGAPPFTFVGEGERLRADYLGRIEIAPNLTAQIGLDASEERFQLDRPDPRSVTTLGAFGQIAWSPVAPATLTAAIRQDQHSRFGGYTTGRVTAAYTLPSDTTLRAAIGTGFRPPSLDELFGDFGANPDLEPERSVSIEAGVDQTLLAGRARLSATLFRIDVDNLIVYDFATDTNIQTDGTSRSQGVELSGDIAVTDRLRLGAGWTYTDARGANGARRVRVPYHDIALSAAWDATDRLTVSANARFVSNVIDGGVRLDDYWLVNATATYEVTEAVDAYLRVENLTNSQYQTVRGYATADRSVFFGLGARF